MDPVTFCIHTGLSHFTMLHTVTGVEKDTVFGTCVFDKTPGFLAMEACAQLGALHVRWIRHFTCHAFLLKVNHFEMPVSDPFDGKYTLFGKLTGKSRMAFSHTIKMTGENGQETKGQFLFAVTPYDDHFDKKILQPHYKKVFSCLENAFVND